MGGRESEWATADEGSRRDATLLASTAYRLGPARWLARRWLALQLCLGSPQRLVCACPLKCPDDLRTHSHRSADPRSCVPAHRRRNTSGSLPLIGPRSALSGM